MKAMKEDKKKPNSKPKPKPNKKKRKHEDFLKDLERKLYKGKQSQRNQRSLFPGQQGKTPPKPPQPNPRTLLWVLLILMFVGLSFLLFNNDQESDANPTDYSEFIRRVQNKEITSCLIVQEERGMKVEFFHMEQKWQAEVPPADTDLYIILRENNVHYKFETRETNQYFLIFLQWLPWIILMAFFWFVLSRQLRNRSGGAFGFSRSKAQVINKEEIRETFGDVQGCDEAKAELEDITRFLKDTRKYIDAGARIPKGILLVGPPGTGKTLLAKAVAGESKVPFLSMSGSDFVELFVGIGASRVRDLFETGKQHAPCIIFIDELDAVGRARGAGYGGGHDEREQTLNQMLVEMDGFGTDRGIIVLAATNRPDILDRALLRPGRFDRQVMVDIPDVRGRKAILELHAKKININTSVDMSDVARGTPGFTGADLANLVNEAALISVREGASQVNLDHIEKAKDKMMLGTERKSLLLSEREKKNTAYHEAGHALVGIIAKNAPPLHKVSIIPRGRALGVTHFLSEDGAMTKTKSSIEAELRVLYGGRVAEELILKDVTNGAMNDIERASKLARSMVCEWGLSSLGPISYGEKDHPVFIGKEIHRGEAHSESTSKKIDDEIKKILDAAYKDALQIIKANLMKLKRLAEALLEKETLEVLEIYKLLKIKPPKKVELLPSP